MKNLGAPELFTKQALTTQNITEFLLLLFAAITYLYQDICVYNKKYIIAQSIRPYHVYYYH